MKELETRWLTIPDAATYLRCGERILRELVGRKEVPHVFFAGKALFCAASLDRWLLEQEIAANPTKPEAEKSAELSEDNRRIRADCPRDQLNSLIAELIRYKKGRERFVNGLGKNLEKDLVACGYALLSPSVYSRLSRWAHPKKHSPRNDWVQERAQEISKLMFGNVIDRVSLPSYRS